MKHQMYSTREMEMEVAVFIAIATVHDQSRSISGKTASSAGAKHRQYQVQPTANAKFIGAGFLGV